MGHRKRIVSCTEMQEVFTSPTNNKRKTVYCIDTMESTDANIVKVLDFNSPSPKPKTVSIGKKPSTKVKDTAKSYEHLRQIAAVKHDIIKHANAFLKFKKAPKHVNIVHDQLKKLNLNMMDNPNSDQLTNSFFHVMAYQTPEYQNLHPDKQHDLLMKKTAAYIGINQLNFSQVSSHNVMIFSLLFFLMWIYHNEGQTYSFKSLQNIHIHTDNNCDITLIIINIYLFSGLAARQTGEEKVELL